MMIQKFKKLCYTATLSLASFGFNAHANPLIEIGDYGNLFFNGGVGTFWKSNIFNDETTKKSDAAIVLSPGLELNLARNKDMFGNLHILFREDIYFYKKYSNLNTQNANVFAQSKFKSGKIGVKADFSFNQLSQNTPEVNLQGTLVERNLYMARLGAEYDFSPKTTIDTAFQYNNEHFKTKSPLLKDHTRVAVPVTFYYRYSPKLEIGPSYSYSHTDVRHGNDTADHFFNLALRGLFTAKLEGKVHAGYTYHKIQNEKDHNEFGLSSSLNWSATPKIMLMSKLFRVFRTGGNGLSFLNTGFRTKTDYAITEQIAANANLGYSVAHYQNRKRKDKTFDLGIGLSYAMNNYVSLETGYSYGDNHSNTKGSSYMNHTLEFAASIRY